MQVIFLPHRLTPNSLDGQSFMQRVQVKTSSSPFDLPNIKSSFFGACFFLSAAAFRRSPHSRF